MTVYVMTVYPKKQPNEGIPPRVFTDPDTALFNFQHQCGSNVSISLTEPTIDTHWKTKTVTRLDPITIAELKS